MGEVLYNSWRKAEAKSELPVEFGLEDRTPVKAIIGWAGLTLLDREVSLPELLRAYVAFVQEESCGRCIPCRVGSKVILDALTRIVEGQGQPGDLELIDQTARIAKEGSLCELGQSFPVPLLDALEHLRPQLGEAIQVGRGGATGLTYHRIVTAPCLNACPAQIDIPAYLQEIAEGHFAQSLATVREKTILVGSLGRICVSPCENNCRRNNLEDPLAIRCLKRFVADWELGLDHRKVHWQKAGGAGVAVVGSGPAGLNAAYQLGRKGYQVTIYEALSVAGGMLAVGIPSYRLPRHILQGEIDLLGELGVEIRLNCRIGQDLSLNDLKDQGFRAIFVATGLHNSMAMGVEGENSGYQGLITGVEFLRRVNLGQPVDLGGRVAVVGGGNVAMDCARVSRRLGAEVNLIYRRSRAEMPASVSEVEEAEREGIKYNFLVNPTRIIAENSQVVGVECIRMQLGEPDASGRRRPEAVQGSEFVIELDTFIPAICQTAEEYSLKALGLDLTTYGFISVNPLTLETNIPGVFAGGDAVYGARTVIDAIAAGNRAAQSIDQYLRTGTVLPQDDDNLQSILDALGVYDRQEKPGLLAGRPRCEESTLPVEERFSGFPEVDLGFSTEGALTEAGRCLRCYRLALVVT